MLFDNFFNFIFFKNLSSMNYSLAKLALVNVKIKQNFVHLIVIIIITINASFKMNSFQHFDYLPNYCHFY